MGDLCVCLVVISYIVVGFDCFACLFVCGVLMVFSGGLRLPSLAVINVDWLGLRTCCVLWVRGLLGCGLWVCCGVVVVVFMFCICYYFVC